MTLYPNDKCRLAVYGPIDTDVLAQMEMVIEATDCKAAALMADNHLGYSMPIGGVVTLQGQVSPSCVGFDIGCGCLAYYMGTDGVLAERVESDLNGLMDDINSSVSIGMGSIGEGADGGGMWDHPGWQIDAVKKLKQNARAQLGSVGSGNHYVDLLTDSVGGYWFAVHTGSRKLGHSVAGHYIGLAGGKDGMMVPPVTLDSSSPLGEEYMLAHDLCLEYAEKNRQAILDRVLDSLALPDFIYKVSNHHNYLERYANDLFTHRKGATLCHPDICGFIGGSMGDISVVFRGVEFNYETYQPAMGSAPHGAGRMMSRGDARRGITEEQMKETLSDYNVVLRGGSVDESPEAYKSLEDVLSHHVDTIEIVRELKPIGVVMASDRRRW